MNKSSIPPRTAPLKPDSQTPVISVYEGKGIQTRGPRIVGNPTGKGGGKRGKIKGWSLSSRRRMRRYLMTHRPCEGYNTFAATLTIPGAPIEADRAQELFKGWSREAVKAGIGSVWRLETQTRGQLHWHLLCAVPEGVSERIIENLWIDQIMKLGWCAVWYDPDKHDKLIERINHDVRTPIPEACYELDLGYVCSLGEQWPGFCVAQAELDDPRAGTNRPVLWLANRYMIPGANLRMCVVDKGDCGAKWLHYLADHATKRKQEQIAVGVGRHWGVVGRKCFTEVLPEDLAIPSRQYSQILRWLRRWHTPSVKDPRAPFGRRLGWKLRRGAWGTSEWFTDESVVLRMIDHALTLVETGPEPAPLTRSRGDRRQSRALDKIGKRAQGEKPEA